MKITYKNVYAYYDNSFPWRAEIMRKGVHILKEKYATKLEAAQAVAECLKVPVESLVKAINGSTDLFPRDFDIDPNPQPRPVKPLPPCRSRILRVVVHKKQKIETRVLSGRGLALSGNIPSQATSEYLVPES
jgi:hypothetical protein